MDRWLFVVVALAVLGPPGGAAVAGEPAITTSGSPAAADESAAPRSAIRWRQRFTGDPGRAAPRGEDPEPGIPAARQTTGRDATSAPASAPAPQPASTGSTQPAEEYEIVLLTREQERQFVQSRERAGSTWWKNGKRLVFADRTVRRVDADGRELASFTMPEDAIPLADRGTREFIGYRLGTKVFILNDDLKEAASFDTILRGFDECITESGKVYVVRWGYKEVRTVLPPGRAPPAPPGFAVYDQTGRITVSEDEASGWEYGGASPKALMALRIVEARRQIRVYSYDGKHQRTVSDANVGCSSPMVHGTASPPLVLWHLGSGKSLILDGNLNTLETFDWSGIAQVNVYEDRLFVLRSPDPLTLTWEVRPIGKKATADPQRLVFDKDEIGGTGRGFGLMPFPGRPDRIVLMIGLGPTDQTLHAYVQPVVADAGTGRIIWTRKPYEIGRLMDTRISLPPWQGPGVIVAGPGPGNAWAILRPKSSDSPPPAAAADMPSEAMALSIEMGATQPADAPVILTVRMTNASDRDMRDYFDQNVQFLAYLTGPDGKMRRVIVTNGSQIEGSLPPAPTLKPGGSVRTPLRLTNYTSPFWRDYLPSEKVYLAPGNYRLRLRRFLPRPNLEDQVEATATFTVVKDAALAKARWDELKNPPEGMEPFARHVLEATLTPEIRRDWYRDIRQGSSAEAALKVYRLSIIDSPPDDVAAGILEGMKAHLEKPDPNDRAQASLLNNAAHFILNHKTPGAGDAMLKLATGPFDSAARSPAFDALPHYWRDEMANRIAPLLASQDMFISVTAARLLAWAGDDRAAETLVARAKRKDSYAAAGLAYLPANAAAAAALRDVLASDDPRLVDEVRRTIAQQRPARGAPAATRPATQPAYSSPINPDDADSICRWGDWEYHCTNQRRKSPSGRLFYRGEPVEDGRAGDYVRTPWGVMACFPRTEGRSWGGWLLRDPDGNLPDLNHGREMGPQGDLNPRERPLKILIPMGDSTQVFGSGAWRLEIRLKGIGERDASWTGRLFEGGRELPAPEGGDPDACETPWGRIKYRPKSHDGSGLWGWIPWSQAMEGKPTRLNVDAGSATRPATQPATAETAAAEEVARSVLAAMRDQNAAAIKALAEPGRQEEGLWNKPLATYADMYGRKLPALRGAILKDDFAYVRFDGPHGPDGWHVYVCLRRSGDTWRLTSLTLPYSKVPPAADAPTFPPEWAIDGAERAATQARMLEGLSAAVKAGSDPVALAVAAAAEGDGYSPYLLPSRLSEAGMAVLVEHWADPRSEKALAWLAASGPGAVRDGIETLAGLAALRLGEVQGRKESSRLLGEAKTPAQVVARVRQVVAAGPVALSELTPLGRQKTFELLLREAAKAGGEDVVDLIAESAHRLLGQHNPPIVREFVEQYPAASLEYARKAGLDKTLQSATFFGAVCRHGRSLGVTGLLEEWLKEAKTDEQMRKLAAALCVGPGGAARAVALLKDDRPPVLKEAANMIRVWHAGEPSRQALREAIERRKKAGAADDEIRRLQWALEEVETAVSRAASAPAAPATQPASGLAPAPAPGRTTRAGMDARIDELLGQLTTGDLATRTQAAEGLGELRDPRAVPGLLAALNDRKTVRFPGPTISPTLDGESVGESGAPIKWDAHALLRAAAARALGRIGDPAAVEALLASALDSELAVRIGSAEALGKIGDKRAVKPLREVLGYPDGRDARAAAAALGEIGGPEAVEALRDLLLKSPHPFLRQSAIEALAREGGDAAVDAIAGALRDKQGATRYVAIRALGKVGSARAVAALRKEWESADSDTQAAIEEALQRRGPVSQPASAPAPATRPASMPTTHPAMSEEAARRSRLLLADLSQFGLDAQYFPPRGGNRAEYPSLTLRVPVLRDERLENWPADQITQEQARQIIEHLAGSGWLERAEETDSPVRDRLPRPEPNGPLYALSVRSAGFGFEERLAFNAQAYWRLLELRGLLHGAAREALDKHMLAALAQKHPAWKQGGETGLAMLEKGKFNLTLALGGDLDPNRYIPLVWVFNGVAPPSLPGLLHVWCRPDEREAAGIIDALAGAGVLESLAEVPATQAMPTQRGYALLAGVGGRVLRKHLGWDAAMRTVLEAVAARMPVGSHPAKVFGEVLDRLEPHRAEWDKAAGLKAAPIDWEKAGDYGSYPWKYAYRFSSDRQGRVVGHWGTIYYRGRTVEGIELNDTLQTPWGRLYWVGMAKDADGPHGWMRQGLADRPAGRELPSPLDAIRYHEGLANADRLRVLVQCQPERLWANFWGPQWADAKPKTAMDAPLTRREIDSLLARLAYGGILSQAVLDRLQWGWGANKSYLLEVFWQTGATSERLYDMDLGTKATAAERLADLKRALEGAAADAMGRVLSKLEANASATQPATTPVSTGDARITELLAQLGSEKVQDRERAHKALVAVGRPAVESLGAAAQGTDVERSLRALAVLEDIHRLTENLAWGDPADGVRCAVRPVKVSFAPDEDIEADILYRNVSGKPIPVCAYPDPLYTWVHLRVYERVTDVGNRMPLLAGRHGTGTRRALRTTDFVTLQPGQTVSFRQVIKCPEKPESRLKPGQYFLQAQINKINRMDKHILGLERFLKEHDLSQPWCSPIESGQAPLTIAPRPTPSGASTQPGSSGDRGPAMLKGHWDDLAGEDPVWGCKAVLAMAEHGEKASAFLAERLGPAPVVDAERIRTLVAGLGSDRYATRQAAAEELLLIHKAAGPELRKGRESASSAEAAARIDALLEALGADDPAAPEPRRIRRAMHVLEMVGDDRARRLVAGLARGAPGAYLTEEATTALERLAKPRPALRTNLEAVREAQKDIWRPWTEVEFAPVVERTVSDRRTGTEFLIDFDTDRQFAPPVGLAGGQPEVTAALAEMTGADAMVCVDGDSRGLRFLDAHSGMMKGQAAREQWDRLTPDSLRKFLNDSRWATARFGGFEEAPQRLREAGNQSWVCPEGELPMTIRFATREGGMGVLRIDAFTKAPGGVKLRYRMLRTTVAAQPAAPQGAPQTEQPAEREPAEAAPNQDLPARIARLIQQLGDGRFAVRDAAQRELVEIGMPAVAALRVALADKDRERASRARAAWGQIEEALVRKILSLPEPELGNIAPGGASPDELAKLEKLRAAQGTGLSRGSLHSLGPTVRAQWATALGDFGDQRIMPFLLDKVGDEDAGVRDAAAAALRKLTGEVFAADAKRWRQWYEAIQRPTETPEVLIAALSDPRDEARVRAIWKLGFLRDPNTVDALVERFVNRRGGGPRGEAVYAEERQNRQDLRHLGGALAMIGEPAIERLIPVAGYGWGVRDDALRIVVSTGDAAVGPAINALGQRATEARAGAAKILGRLRPLDAVVPLAEACGGFQTPHIPAFDALLAYDKSALPGLRAAFADANFSLVSRASAAVLMMRWGDRSGEAMLKEIVEKGSRQDMNGIVHRMGRTADRVFLPFVEKALRRNDAEQGLTYAAAACGGQNAIPMLRDALNHPNEAVRNGAKWQLEKLQGTP